MSAIKRDEELRRGSNPLFNDRKLKLGTFCTNLDYGAAITTIEGTLRISWPATLALAKLADEMEFGRWYRSGAGARRQHPNRRRRLPNFSWAAGMAVDVPAIFATSHVPTVHPSWPPSRVRPSTISNGRFVSNVVTGWNLPEIECSASFMLDHVRASVPPNGSASSGGCGPRTASSFRGPLLQDQRAFAPGRSASHP